MAAETYKHQQGDVQLFAVADVPVGVVEIPESEHRGVLAEGEVTGHSHRMAGPVRLFRVPGPDGGKPAAGGDVFMAVPRRIEMQHQEHGAQWVEKGTYRVGRVREYDYATEESRRVED